MIESADKEYYGFEYKDCDGKTYKTRIESAGPMWPEVLNDFVSFLETIYQYDIKSQIKVQEPTWFAYVDEFDRESLQGWRGKFFVAEDEQNTDDRQMELF